MRLTKKTQCSRCYCLFHGRSMLLLLLLLINTQMAFSQTIDTTSYTDLLPVLSQRCVMCHAGDAAPLGLRLDSLAAILRGSSRGVVVKAGDPEGSELIRRLRGISLPRMPMTGPPYLSDSEIAMFEAWVIAGMQSGSVAQTQLAPDLERQQTSHSKPVTYLDVAPIFAMRCVSCHIDGGVMGPAPEGFVLTSYAATIASNDRARVVAGNPQASELLRRIRGQARPRMPYDGPPYLSSAEIDLIERWIVDGARDAVGKSAAIPVGAKIRLHGTLNSKWQLDGLDLIVGAGTRLDKSPQPGDYVQVRGRLTAGAKVNAKRIRRR